jgi:signal transduction histidine kinase
VFKTLYGKLVAVLLGLFFVIGVSYILLTLFTTRIHLQEVNQELNLTLAQNLVSEKILMKEGQVNEEAMKEVMHMLMAVNPTIEIYLLDPQGKILTYSATPGKVKRKRISLDPVKTFLGATHALPILGDDPRDLNRRKIFSVAPISGEKGVEGYVYIVLGGEEYDTVVQMLQGSYILKLSAWTAVGGLVFIFLAGLVFFHLLTRRLKRLTATMEDFTQSDFSQPLDFSFRFNSTSGDEIDRLGATFNRMADRILQQLTKLKQTDRLRRELVANVSHDLRTPLASLQGYLETLLLKEGKLSPEEQRNYLEIATRHSERLGKLVSELFELAKLDSQETQPHLEAFSLGELVQDVALKFKLPSQNKRIRLETDFREDLPFVWADIGLIERVLVNLIENAIRYTPEGGMIALSLKPSNDKIKVEVKDTGCGIPPKEIPYIFDRFYSVEKDRSEAGSAGLGLAIAKRILELHGSSIEVQSHLNAGTTFTFSLVVYKP